MNDVARDLAGADDIAKVLSRKEWSAKASEVYDLMDIRIIELIVAGGEDEWIQMARRGFAGQGFRQEDFISMFHKMRYRLAKSAARPRVVLDG